jgi:tetraacyldisaccharide 4'-kinase
MLSQNGINAIHHPFPDHHRFKSSDFKGVPQGSMILMTEKDAVKCRNLQLRNAWYVPVDAVLNSSCEQQIRQRFHSMAERNG